MILALTRPPRSRIPTTAVLPTAPRPNRCFLLSCLFFSLPRKFVDFLMEFLPTPPQARPADWAQHSWIEEDMRKSLRVIYGHRSRALHDGIPFPAPMCETAMRLDPQWAAPAEKPLGDAVSTAGGVWVRQDIPMLLQTFEHIARGALLEWWRKGTPEQAEEFSPIYSA